MGRIRNSIELAKSSWSVLKADKELVALPIISLVATLIVAASFVVPFFMTAGLDTGEAPGPLVYILTFVLYVALAYITIFFNAALIHAADERLSGGDPTVGSALRGAAARAGKILPWAIVSATVSIILRAVRERGGALGQIASSLAGIAWALVTFLVLPILVIEGVKVGDAIKRSTELFKRTWGENVAAQVGFGLLGFVAALPGIAVAALGISVGGAAIGIGIGIGILWIVVVGVVLATLNGIFQTALYHYAVDGTVPSGYFSDNVMRSAFVPRQRRGGFGGGFVGG